MKVYVGFDQTNKNWNYFLCDGVADDVQIQAALDALPRWGGTVQLASNTYSLVNSIHTSKNNAGLQGTEERYAYISVQKDNSLTETIKEEE